MQPAVERGVAILSVVDLDMSLPLALVWKEGQYLSFGRQFYSRRTALARRPSGMDINACAGASQPPIFRALAMQTTRARCFPEGRIWGIGPPAFQ
jgi:hypothetical protein